MSMFSRLRSRFARVANRPTAGAGRRWGYRILPALVAIVVGAVVGVAFAAIIDVPRVDTLADFTPGLITELRDRNDRVFATYAKERRILLGEDELPPLIEQAVLAAEDSHFFGHGGVDAVGVARAALKNVLQGRRAQGGSTLTMQLARQLYLNPEKTWRRKVEEAFLAVEIEKNFTKQQILTLYCNLVFLGHGVYGMEAAAEFFFERPAAELEPHEAAMLAGIVQRPSAYSPYRAADLVRERRNYVLRRMFEEGFLDREAFEAATAAPLGVVPRRRRDDPAPYFAEEVRRYLTNTYGSETLLQKGLTVSTTLDADVQRAAEDGLRVGLRRLDRRKGWRGAPRHFDDEDLSTIALESWARPPGGPEEWVEGLVESADRDTARIRTGDRTWEIDRRAVAWTRRGRIDEVLRRGDVAWFSIEREDGQPERLELEQEPELEAAVLVLESATGAIRGMVGGWDFDRSEFNRATQARRQVGSALKPFVYGAALETGLTAADTLFDAPFVLPGATNELTYSPRNYYRKYYGIITMRRALELSTNVTAVKILDLVGVEQVIDFSRRAGIRSELPPYPSLALGAADLSVLELAAAYATIANHGIHLQPYLIEEVRDRHGRILEAHQARASKAMEPQIAFILTRMLEGVIDRGTANTAKDLETDLAGKTGTHDDYTDAWFAGFTPRYTVLTWVGYDVKRRIGRNMTGAEAALPIWRAVIEKGLSDGWIQRAERFASPSGIELVPVEYMTGLLPGPGADRVIEEAFVAGTQPTLQYDPHWARVARLAWYQQRPFYIPKAGERMPEDVEDWAPVLQAWSE